MARYSCIALVGSLIAACSSQMHVKALPPNETEINGIPFRTKEQYKISLYKKNSTGTYERALWKEAPIKKDGKRDADWSPTHSLADPDRLYVLQYLGLPLANMTAEVKLNEDGTLSTVDFKDTSQADEAFKAAGEQGKNLGDLLATQAIAREAETAAREAEEMSALDRDVAFQKALVTYARAKLALEAAEEGSAAWNSAKLDLDEAMIDANDKARRAGRRPPFPDAS